MYSYKKVFLVICVTLNCVDVNSGNSKKKWQNHGPNFDPEYPQFTPFNSNEFFNVNSDLSEDQDKPSDPVQDINASEQQLIPPFSDPSQDGTVQDRLKPLKTLVLGLYQNYRNSYIANKTTPAPKVEEDRIEDVENKIDESNVKPKRIHTKKKSKKKVLDSAEQEKKYNVGPGVNLSLDHQKELVNVYLDEDCLKDVFTGRGRKNDLISKILPLFILPFLIQSAIVPFVVATLKLFLMKSIVVGKLAIFLLIVSAFKNHVKYSNYEAAPPSYYVDPPSRRSEAGTPGYRVEGKPTTWVN